MKRRSLLAAMLAASTAPAVVGAGVLMPVRKIITPPGLDQYLDSVRYRLEDGGFLVLPDFEREFLDRFYVDGLPKFDLTERRK